MRFVTAALAYAVAGPMGKLVAHSAAVADAPFEWGNIAGPWFDNSIAILEELPDGLSVRWHTGVVEKGDYSNPRLQTIADVLIEPKRVSRVAERRESEVAEQGCRCSRRHSTCCAQALPRDHGRRRSVAAHPDAPAGLARSAAARAQVTREPGSAFRAG